MISRATMNLKPAVIELDLGPSRIVDLIPNAADVQLPKLMIGRPLQGPAPFTSVILSEPGLSGTSGIITRTLQLAREGFLA